MSEQMRPELVVNNQEPAKAFSMLLWAFWGLIIGVVVWLPFGIALIAGPGWLGSLALKLCCTLGVAGGIVVFVRNS